VMWCLAWASFLSILFLVCGDEMAFVDVSSTDSINIRSLEFEVETSPGPANFFTTDPMAAHDWVNQQAVNKTFNFIVSGVETSGSAIADKVRELEVQLGPLVAALPKNEHGLLGNGTARYALQRFFRQQHGWSLKGLEPAGSAWIASMAVTPDVRQLTKYIVLGYLHGRAYELNSGAGISLRSLAILVATLEQVVRSDTLETLYSVFRTLRLPLAGVRSAEEVDDILAAYMAVYGFGTNLEVSTQKDLVASVQHLQKHHPAWSDLLDFVRSVRGPGRAGALDFASLLEVVEDMADEYAKWQTRSCSQLGAALRDHPQYSDGRLALSAAGPSLAPGLARSFLTESPEELDRLGAVAPPAETQSGSLLVANYLSSKAMCLPTASLYQVCCPSECDALLLHLEKEVAAPAAGFQRLAEALRTWRDTSGSAPVGDHHFASLQTLAENQAGAIALHSQEFAQWLHGVFPSLCPAPSSQGRLSPHTAGDWMLDPGDSAEDTEALVTLGGQVASRFVTLGVDIAVAQAARQAAQAEAEDEDDEGVIAWRDENFRSGAARWGSDFCKFAIQIFIVVSMVKMVSKIGASTCRTAWPGQMKTKGVVERPFDSLA